MKIVSLLQSRRAWATVATAVFTAFAPGFGIPAEQAMTIAGVIAAWVLGDSIKNTM